MRGRASLLCFCVFLTRCKISLPADVTLGMGTPTASPPNPHVCRARARALPPAGSQLLAAHGLWLVAGLCWEPRGVQAARVSRRSQGPRSGLQSKSEVMAICQRRQPGSTGTTGRGRAGQCWCWVVVLLVGAFHLCKNTWVEKNAGGGGEGASPQAAAVCCPGQGSRPGCEPLL